MFKVLTILVFSLIATLSYAEDLDGLCYFAGWPSLSINGKCQLPWEVSNNPKLNESFRTYKNGYYCTQANHIRCNPILYGGREVPELDVSTNFSGSIERTAGVCVPYVVGESEARIFERCDSATAELKNKHKEKLKNDTENVREYEEYVSGLVDSCDKARTDNAICSLLYGRLDVLEGVNDCGQNSFEKSLPTHGNNTLEELGKISTMSGNSFSFGRVVESRSTATYEEGPTQEQNQR